MGNFFSRNPFTARKPCLNLNQNDYKYANLFSAERGAPALSFRIALGALIIKEKLGTSDRETVEQIQENPYLQYFLGQESYSNEPPFNASMFVHFRERIGKDL